jgi:hypothetical protein
MKKGYATKSACADCRINSQKGVLGAEIVQASQPFGFLRGVPGILREQGIGFGEIAAAFRRVIQCAEIEAATGRPVVSPRNMLKEPDGGLWAQLPDADDE